MHLTEIFPLGFFFLDKFVWLKRRNVRHMSVAIYRDTSFPLRVRGIVAVGKVERIPGTF